MDKEQDIDFTQKNQIRNRIISLIEELNLDRSSFANSINVKQATLSHILTGRNDPTLNIILQIHNTYPSVDINWLLYGKGDSPFTTEDDKPKETQEPIRERIVYEEKKQKKITEIRVFYDDQTFDVFTLK